jgi:ribosomal protein S18 acetylase RimI-like enzyme
MKISPQFFIRPALTNDIEMLQKLCIETFTDTYAKYNKEEDIQLYITEHFNHKNLLDELENQSNFFFVGILNHEAAGYMKLRTSYKLMQLKNKKSIELERIYVVKHLQGAGLGYGFIQFAIEFAQSKEYDIIWLGVWKRNKKAMEFYKKCGFKIFGEHKFTLGTDEQSDWLMKKELRH